MVDQAALNKRRLIRVISSKIVWLPIIAGAIVALLSTSPMSWIGWAAVAAGCGAGIWKLSVGSKRLTQEAIDDLREQADQEHYAYLRSLQRKLRRDKDARTGKILRRLREIHKRISRLGDSPSGQTWREEIHDQIKNLYRSSVAALDRSFELWESAQQMATDQARQDLIESRARVLDEVTQSIEHLGRTLDQVQASVVTNELPQHELSSLRAELEQGLTVARNIESRIQQLEDDIRGSTGVRDGS